MHSHRGDDGTATLLHGDNRKAAGVKSTKAMVQGLQFLPAPLRKTVSTPKVQQENHTYPTHTDDSLL
jgi:hypothetical protein